MGQFVLVDVLEEQPANLTLLSIFLQRFFLPFDLLPRASSAMLSHVLMQHFSCVEHPMAKWSGSASESLAGLFIVVKVLDVLA